MSRPLRILLTISDLSGGGAERQLSLLVKHLSRARFELHLALWRPIFDYPIPDDITIHILRKDRPWQVVRLIRELRGLIDRLRPDLVYSLLHYVNMATGTALAGSRHRPRWICRQSNDPRRDMKGPFALWARWAIRQADRVIGCSEGVSQATTQHLRLFPNRVYTIDNIADVSKIKDLASEPLPIEKRPGVLSVVHAGRFERQKNQAMLIDALSHLRNTPVELWMLGAGRLEDRLRGLARALDVDHQIRWLGFQKNPFRFFRAADCLALTSDWEGLPNAVIESMICGTPVVSTRCPYGPEELIEDGTSGLLVPVGNAELFAEALSRLANDPEGRRHMGRAASAQATARFDVQRTCAAYEELFMNVAGQDK
jgi:glycosyltransferase involved in cell wall biosynthesis